MKSKKAQLNIGDAPAVVLIVLFLFMVLATSAFVLEKYGESFTDISVTITNETLLNVTETGKTIVTAGRCNFEKFVVTVITNATAGNVVPTTNYTYTQTGTVTYSGLAPVHFNDTNWNVSYTFNYGGTACNVTDQLTEEVEDNVSIAGMILTISLIGIVLSILIGLFYVFTTGGGRRTGM